jgi:hypothetical protein
MRDGACVCTVRQQRHLMLYRSMAALPESGRRSCGQMGARHEHHHHLAPHSRHARLCSGVCAHSFVRLVCRCPVPTVACGMRKRVHGFVCDSASGGPVLTSQPLCEPCDAQVASSGFQVCLQESHMCRCEARRRQLLLVLLDGPRYTSVFQGPAALLGTRHDAGPVRVAE